MSENYKNELVQRVSKPSGRHNSAALQNLLIRDWDRREYVKLSYLKGSCPTSTVSIKLTSEQDELSLYFDKTKPVRIRSSQV